MNHRKKTYPDPTNAVLGQPPSKGVATDGFALCCILRHGGMANIPPTCSSTVTSPATYGFEATPHQVPCQAGLPVAPEHSVIPKQTPKCKTTSLISCRKPRALFGHHADGGAHKWTGGDLWCGNGQSQSHHVPVSLLVALLPHHSQDALAQQWG